MPESSTGGDAAVVTDKPPVVVKKYANRRLYDTESSSYITLDSLADMVRAGRDFVVYDAKSGDDITRSVLTQIIVEEESKGRALLPTGFLRQLIGFYGDSMQNLVPRYLESAMASFARQQEQMRLAMQQTMGNLFPFPGMEAVSRQNMAMVERAMSLFSPFYRQEPGQSEAAEPNLQNPPDPPNPLQPELDALRAEVQRLRVELAASEARAVAADPVLGPGPEQSPAPYAAMEPAQAVKATQSRRRAKTEPSRH